MRILAYECAYFVAVHQYMLGAVATPRFFKDLFAYDARAEQALACLANVDQD